MEDDFKLQDSKIAIVGLGLMGGSLALALKGKCAALYGIDTHRPTLKLALAKRIVDAAGSDPAPLLPQADLVVLAAPVPAILEYLQKLPSLIKRACIVTDLGSTKSQIVSAMDALPERFEAVGGHPICGKEMPALKNADGALYRSASFVVVPTRRTTARARSAAEQIISAIGARSVELDAAEHDRTLAFTSHLPFLISSALVSALPQEYIDLIGTGFRSNARLAGTPASMMLGILRSNRENVLNALRSFRDSLTELEENLRSENYIQIEKCLDQSRLFYQEIVHR